GPCYQNIRKREVAELLRSSDTFEKGRPHDGWSLSAFPPSSLLSLPADRAGKRNIAASAQLLQIRHHFPGKGNAFPQSPADSPLPPLTGIQTLLRPFRPGNRLQLPQKLYHPPKIRIDRHPSGNVHQNKKVPHIGGRMPFFVEVSHMGPEGGAAQHSGQHLH